MLFGIRKWIVRVLCCAMAVPLAYCAWLLVRMLLFDYFTVPTSSMSPTIEAGSKVIVNKLIFGARIYTDLNFKRSGQELKSFRMKGLRNIRHNDIVVFNFPVHRNRMSFVINHVYCKRVIGLPGDTVGAVNGHLYNNNYSDTLGCAQRQKQLESKPEHVLRRYNVLDVFPRDSLFGWKIKDWGPLYVPRKGDIINMTPKEAVLYRRVLEWEIGKKITWDLNKWKVYAGGKELRRHRFTHDYYHICGDYALDSFDSRYWGFVPEEYIVGVVGMIINKYDARV